MTIMTSLKPPNNLMRWELLFFPHFINEENLGTERINNLPEVTQLQVAEARSVLRNTALEFPYS